MATNVYELAYSDDSDMNRMSCRIAHLFLETLIYDNLNAC